MPVNEMQSYLWSERIKNNYEEILNEIFTK